MDTAGDYRRITLDADDSGFAELDRLVQAISGVSSFDSGSIDPNDDIGANAVVIAGANIRWNLDVKTIHLI